MCLEINMQKGPKLKKFMINNRSQFIHNRHQFRSDKNIGKNNITNQIKKKTVDFELGSLTEEERMEQKEKNSLVK